MADYTLPPRSRDTMAYKTAFAQARGARRMMSNRGNNSPVLDNVQSEGEFINAFNHKWDNMAPEQAAKFGNDYDAGRPVAPAVPTGNDAQNFSEAVGSMTPDDGKGAVHHSASDLIGDVPAVYHPDAPQAVMPPPMAKAPDTNFSSTNPAFRAATGMSDPSAIPNVPAANPNPGMPFDLAKVDAAADLTPKVADAPTGPVRTPDGAIRAFAGAENDTARFGDKLTGSGNLADVQAAAKAATASATPAAPAVVSATTPTAAPSEPDVEPDDDADDTNAALPTKTPGIDEPGGLNDQLATSARDEGAKVAAQRTADFNAAQQPAPRPYVPITNPVTSFPTNPDGSFPVPTPDPAGPVTMSDQQSYQKNMDYAKQVAALPHTGTSNEEEDATTPKKPQGVASN